MIRAIAIDDEPPALNIIKLHAAAVPFLQLEACFLRPSEALAYLNSNEIDLVFIDISMPDLSGIEFAGGLKDSCQIVFTTAYSEFALKGFELAATDYLLKPIPFSRFFDACMRCKEKMEIKDSRKDPIDKQSLFLKDGHDWIKINFDDILYIKGEDNYACIYEQTRKTLSRITLSSLQEQLPANTFIRVHKSYIVSSNHISKLEKGDVFIAGVRIPISRKGRDTLVNIWRSNVK